MDAIIQKQFHTFIFFPLVVSVYISGFCESLPYVTCLSCLKSVCVLGGESEGGVASVGQTCYRAFFSIFRDRVLCVDKKYEVTTTSKLLPQ